MEYFPDNTLTHYRVRLPQFIDLDGEWEVGLAEIQYPISWYNVTGSKRRIRVTYRRNQNAKLINKEAMLPEGYYSDVDTLMTELNRLMEGVEGREKPAFSYDALSQKVSVDITNKHRVKLENSLYSMLGFGGADAWIDDDNKKSSNVVDLAQGFHNLYIYANVVEPRVVGDSLVPLLRIVPIQGNHGEVASEVFNPIHYVPLQLRQFQMLEVYIRDDVGDPVAFERGKVVVTLHFRRRPFLAQRR